MMFELFLVIFVLNKYSFFFFFYLKVFFSSRSRIIIIIENNSNTSRITNHRYKNDLNHVSIHNFNDNNLFSFLNLSTYFLHSFNSKNYDRFRKIFLFIFFPLFSIIFYLPIIETNILYKS